MVDPLPPAPRQAVLTVRSVLLGLAGVCFVCGLAPYNDYVLENTLLIGNFLPVGLLLVLLVLILAVNVPLRRFAPRHALRQGELAVVTLMVLVACSVPTSGLMRYLPGGIVGIYGSAADQPGYYGPAVDNAKIPDWILPDLGPGTAAEKGYSPVINYFRSRSPDGSVPWAAWVRPFFAWGVLIALLWGLVIGLSLIVRKQWVENERLSFPLATLYGSLIESPGPGRLLNPLFRSTGFWVAAGAVFMVRGLNALNAYDPVFPSLPLGYDLRDMLVDPPWSYTAVTFKTADLYFAMIGIAFFIQTKTAFSLWFCFVAWQAVEMAFATANVPFTDNMRTDQTYGAIVAFSGVILYLGRRHWWMVLRHMVGARRANDGESAYLPYGVTGWLTAACSIGVVTWLMAAGMTALGAIGLTLSLVTMFMVVARVMADTGLLFVQLNVTPMRGFYYPVLVPATPAYTPPTNFFFAGWFTHLFHDLRECLSAFFQLGVKVADDAIDPHRRPRRVAVGLLAAVVLSLGTGYAVSWASMLTVEYHYAQTTSSTAGPVNEYGTIASVKKNVLDPAVEFQNGGLTQELKTPLSNPLLHLSAGGVAVLACSALRVLLPWWPIHPVAFVVVYSFAMSKIWLSVLVGWVAKVCVVRFGGAALLRRGRPVFIGLILGEVFAAAFWLLVNLALNASGHAYKPLLFLPG